MDWNENFEIIQELNFDFVDYKFEDKLEKNANFLMETDEIQKKLNIMEGVENNG